jgi:uncharacterized membrane protein
MVHRVNKKRLSRLALCGFIFSFLIAIVGLILCSIALNKIDERKDSGKGLAVSGIIISIINMILAIFV